MKSTFNLIRMIYRDLNTCDYFGLKILKDGYNPAYSTINEKGGFHNEVIDKLTQPTNKYLQDILCFEQKELNTEFKFKHLHDFYINIHNDAKRNFKFYKQDNKDAQLRQTELKNQTTNAIKTTIELMENAPNYNIDGKYGYEVKGPYKWIVILLGPHHQPGI